MSENEKPKPSVEGISVPEAPEDQLDPVEVEEPLSIPRLTGSRRSGPRSMQKKAEAPAPAITPEQRLLLLDTWRRSGLGGTEFAAMTGVARHTLYVWKKRFDEHGPGGLVDRQSKRRGSRLPDLTRRTILMMKEANPEWGCERISDMLLRGPALPASAGAVARVLKEEGYEVEEIPTHPHPDKVRRFERARPNQLWQTDLFTFVLKRQNRRIFLIAFMDDHSRFLVGYGLYGSSSGPMVMEVLRAAIASYGAPEEILTDNGPQYVTWRGKSAFTKELEKRGIQQVIARPRHPQTLGKIERFWGSLWRECLETTVFLDLEDARRRIGHYIDHYNFQRPHQGLDGLFPADRFFGAAPEVLKTLKDRVAANAIELARAGIPKQPFYVTGQVGGKGFSLHAEGERMILTREQGERQEVDLTSPPGEPTTMPEPVCPVGAADPEPAMEEPAPGTSAIDELLEATEDPKKNGETT